MANMAGSLVALALFFWFLARLAGGPRDTREQIDTAAMSSKWMIAKGYGRGIR